jgi:hypothetical protein
MSRGMDRPDSDKDAERDQQRTSQSRMTLSQGRGGGGSNEQERRPREQVPTSSQRSSSRTRESVERYRLSPKERETMMEIGRFRALSVEDLTKYRYDLRNLSSQGLLEQRTVTVGRGRQQVSAVALSRTGKRVSQRMSDTSQMIYAGIVKPREVGHDTAIYRMYQAEAERIESAGGRVARVVLDYELKRNVYSPLAKSQDLPALEYARRQAEIAEENGLRVVNGKIPVPDLRIEYETAEADYRHIDLELATEHYTRDQMAAKASAGFTVYRAVSTSRGSRPEWEGRELTAVILGG